MWNGFKFYNPNITSTESARRYWSFFQLAGCSSPFGGISPNLCNAFIQYDSQYYSPFNNFFSYDYQPLRKLMQDNINFPIKTDFERNQPRLLLLSVDVKDCSTDVTFDSYRTYKRICDVCDQELAENKSMVAHIKKHINEVIKLNQNIDLDIISKSIPTRDGEADSDLGTDDHVWTTIYGDEDKDRGTRKHVISHNGIDNNILMTSCLFPYSSNHTSLYDLVSKENRTFWDGAFLSNTPLRKLLQKHKDFWISYFDANNIDYDKKGEYEYKIYQNDKDDRTLILPMSPDLEVFIVNLYPDLETKYLSIPKDKDKVEDRINDIRFHDRSKYDEKVAHLVTDYVDLTRRLIKLAKDTGKVNDEDIETILKISGESTKRDVKEKRNLMDLVLNKFRVKVYRIDREDDVDTIFGKASDFTPSTLHQIYSEGIRDANEWFRNKYKEWEMAA